MGRKTEQVDWEEDGEQVGRTVPGCTVARPGGRAVDLSFFKTGTKPNPAPTETGLVGFMAERRYTYYFLSFPPYSLLSFPPYQFTGTAFQAQTPNVVFWVSGLVFQAHEALSLLISATCKECIIKQRFLFF
jgi:hypothetical protein